MTIKEIPKSEFYIKGSYRICPKMCAVRKLRLGKNMSRGADEIPFDHNPMRGAKVRTFTSVSMIT